MKFKFNDTVVIKAEENEFYGNRKGIVIDAHMRDDGGYLYTVILLNNSGVTVQHVFAEFELYVKS